MTLRIGSRGSALAKVQSETIAAALRAAHPGLEISFRWITTTGDQHQGPSLQAIGGKALFVKEIEESLLKNEIDLAVHSLKDVPQELPFGLKLGVFPQREDARDVLISRFGEQLQELPRGSTIGTSSPRRRAQILNRYKKRYRVEPFRGNVDTRLKKVQQGDVDAIVMAAAGLKRLGFQDEITQYLDAADMLPAACQGCLGLELRGDDAATEKLLAPLHHEPSAMTARAERAFLLALGGDCYTPVAAASSLVGKEIKMEALLLSTDGDRAVRVKESGPAEQSELVGAKLAGRLLIEGGSEILLNMEKPA